MTTCSPSAMCIVKIFLAQSSFSCSEVSGCEDFVTVPTPLAVNSFSVPLSTSSFYRIHAVFRLIRQPLAVYSPSNTSKGRRSAGTVCWQLGYSISSCFLAFTINRVKCASIVLRDILSTVVWVDTSGLAPIRPDTIGPLGCVLSF